MRSFFYLLMVAAMAMLLACHSVVSIGDQDIAVCECGDGEMYIVFDLKPHSITVWNQTTERMNVWVRLKRGSEWYDVLKVEIHSTNEGPPRHYTVEGVPYGEGSQFFVAFKRPGEKEWKTFWIVLQRDDGGQLKVFFLPDSTSSSNHPEPGE